jgi:hypothetical protein
MHLTTRVRLALQFFVPFTQGSPKWGDLNTADCLFIQAYGRTTYSDAEVFTRLQELRLQAGDDDFFMFNLLRQLKFNPGLSNRQLAAQARQLSRKYNLVIIAQWEVAFALYDSHPKWFMENRQRLIAIWPGREYYDTWRVKSDSVRAMKALGLKRPIELSHQTMRLRATMIIWRHGVNAFPYHCHIGYDKQSVQIHTRYPVISSFWDWLTRGYNLIKGQIRFHPPR